MTRLINIPNFLSAYRLIVMPLIVYSIMISNKQAFTWLICINLITDILDGLIARYLNQCTEFGAKLDAYADLSTFLLAISGFWFFEKAFVLTYLAEFSILFACFLIPQIASLIKFGKPTSFHLYSSKITGYFQGIFIFTYFALGFDVGYFYFMLILGALSEIEVLLMVLCFPTIISDAKSIFYQWYQIRNRKNN